jgi:hypothetical protein
MIVVVAGSGFVLLTLPIMLRWLGRRLNPRRWTHLTTAALISGCCLLLGAGLLSSMSTVLSAIGVPKLARECDLMLGQITSAGSPIAIAIGALSASTVALGAMEGPLDEQEVVDGTGGRDPDLTSRPV